MPVYLIHFDEPLAHARHYIGYARSNVKSRLEKHRSGNGAKLLRALNDKGIKYDVVRIWPKGDQTFERKLKKQSRSACLCPLCQTEAKAKEKERRLLKGYDKNRRSKQPTRERLPSGCDAQV